MAKMPGQQLEINELANYQTQAKNGVTNWIDSVGGAAKASEIVAQWAHEVAPDKTILYNDFQNGDLEIKMLDQMQKDGKLPDAIGMQLHMDQGEWPLARVEETVNKLAKFGKPIYITEISVMSGEHRLNPDFDQDKELRELSKTFAAMEKAASPQDQQKIQALVNDSKPLQDMGYIARSQMAYGDRSDLLKSMETRAQELEDPQLKDQVLKEIEKAQTNPWPSEISQEQKQADYTENLYKLLHQNPHVQGITGWDLGDKYSWKDAPRGWFHEDGTPKLVVARMEKLFQQWQEQEHPSTDSAGQATARLNVGVPYVATATFIGADGKKYSGTTAVPDGAGNIKIIVRPVSDTIE